ncbi:hypothetical protein bcgnr5390_58780 [Bacillus luti]
MYLIFIFVIDIVHMSLSVKSILVIVMPFVVLVIIQRAILYVLVNRNKEKKRVFNVMIIALIPFIVCTVQLGVNEYTSKFNQNRWLNDADKRVHMVDDLLQKYKLIGKSNEEVIKLLGVPTETRNEEMGATTSYYLGNERSFISIDSERLVLQFDNDGNVIEYKVQRD